MAKTAIAFSADLPEEQTVTRAGTPLEDYAQSFKVWGYKNMSLSAGVYGDLQTVMPAYTVNWVSGSAATTTSNSSGWEYVAQQTGSDPDQTIKYWDFKASAYRFFGVTNSTTDGANGTNTAYEFTMTANASPIREGGGSNAEKIAANIAATPFFSHLWFSNGNPTDYPTRKFGQPVLLEFLRPFARVRFLFTYSYVTEGIKIRTKAFKPTDGVHEIYRKGTVTITYPLTGTETRESFSVTPEAVTDVYTAVANGTTLTSGQTYYTSNTGAGKFVSNGTEVSDGNYFTLTNKLKLDAFTEEYIPDGGPTKEIWYTVLPAHAAAQGSYTMYVRMNNDGYDKTAVVPEQYMEWLPGYSYTYIFKITEEGGVAIEDVQSAVTPWIEMIGSEDLYNW